MQWIGSWLCAAKRTAASNIDTREQRFALAPSSRAGEDASWLQAVKWYNEQKGYGFIQSDSGGKDLFVHASALERAGMRGLA
jgi:hypothetical protein